MPLQNGVAMLSGVLNLDEAIYMKDLFARPGFFLPVLSIAWDELINVELNRIN